MREKQVQDLSQMKWPSALIILIVTLSNSFFCQTASVNYVTPSVKVTCRSEQSPCLTLDEYASEPANTYFVNNSIFYFLPGSHRMNHSLRLINVQNLSLQGLPADNEVINIKLLLVSITWEKCSNITISSIIFQANDNFTHAIVFNCTHLVRLSNISILGNGYSGCSSILSLQSTVDITSSKFIGIQGWFGAAVLILESSVRFAGNNTFADNRALSGGGIHLFNSTLVLTGTNLFMNNTVLSRRDDTECLTSWQNKKFERDHGGAINCVMCNIIAYEHISFTENTAFDSGGALMVEDGSVTIQGTALFDGNSANGLGGGAITAAFSFLKVCGNITFANNTSPCGGALGLFFNVNFLFKKDQTNSECLQNNSILFHRNTATERGGSIFSQVSFLMFSAGTVQFEQNTAHIEGGAVSNMASNITFIGTVRFYGNGASLHGGAITSNAESTSLFEGDVQFDQNTAHEGGAVCNKEGNITFIGRVRFHGNKAFLGGAVEIDDGSTSFEGDVQFERNTANNGGAMALIGGSKLNLVSTLNISFVLNSAYNIGGAIYFKDDECLSECTTFTIIQ